MKQKDVLVGLLKKQGFKSTDNRNFARINKNNTANYVQWISPSRVLITDIGDHEFSIKKSVKDAIVIFSR